MEIETGRLPKDEQVPLLLRGLFEQRGYRRYRMSNFEAYDLYRENKNFLESEGIITFTDASGRLMALKPDVTMSIVKHTKPDAVSSKLYYVENVFRLAPQSGEYREISQMGLEFIGGQGGYAEAEAVELAVRSLAAIGPQTVLDVGHMGFITSLLDVLGVREEARAAALDALRAKNAHTLRAIAAESGCTEEEAGQLAALAALAGPFPETLDAARALVAAPGMADACGELQSLYDALEAVDAADTLRLDFSTLNDIDYYNGVVFKGYVRGVPRAVLAGGRYDNLMRRFGKPQPAVGFALYLGGLGRAFAEKSDYDVDTLLLYDGRPKPGAGGAGGTEHFKKRPQRKGRTERAGGPACAPDAAPWPGRSGPRDRRWRHMLNIALPKGRLGDKVYGLFSSIGYDCAAIYEDNRKLVFENPERGVRYLLVKPSDVAIYVEHGAGGHRRGGQGRVAGNTARCI